MGVESLRRLAAFMLWDWNELGSTTLLKMFAMIRRLRPQVDETTAMELFSRRAPLKFDSLLQDAENLEIADNILDADDRKDARDAGNDGMKQKANLLQMAGVAMTMCKKESGSRIVQAILKAADLLDAKAPVAKGASVKAPALKQVDPQADDLRACLSPVTGCRIQLVEARRVYYAEYPRDYPPRSHTKTWPAIPGGLSRGRALFECWRWAWLAHQENTGEVAPYSLEWAG